MIIDTPNYDPHDLALADISRGEEVFEDYGLPNYQEPSRGR